jgi:hypothetical protein
MDAFHDDVRDLAKVHVVHGFWKSEDASRLNLQVCQTVSPVHSSPVDIVLRPRLRSTLISHFIQHTCRRCLGRITQR